jgi:dTDP-4-amino-4,6-dideoxygalactose transaminase
VVYDYSERRFSSAGLCAPALQKKPDGTAAGLDAKLSDRIPLNDLVRNTQQLRPELDAAVARVLDSGYYVLGPENAALEDELGAYLGAAHVVLVGNGTDALQIALTVVGVQYGDAVMTVANAGAYTFTAARALGAELVYVDVDASSHLMSLATFNVAIASASRLPKVVVVTHLYGSVADIGPIVNRARGLGIAVVEDCAQALGARRDGRMAGTFGDISTTSFYPTKNLGAIGDAGALFTSQPKLAEAAKRVRQYGWESKYRITAAGGMNSRMDELQAAILRVKLPHLDKWNERRRSIHAEYQASSDGQVRFVTSSIPGHNGHLAVIEVEHRDRVRQMFDEMNIATDIHYPIPDHLQPVVTSGTAAELSVTEFAAQHILSIPLFPQLRDDEITRVGDALRRL